MGDHPRESVLHDVLTLIPLHDVLERENYLSPSALTPHIFDKHRISKEIVVQLLSLATQLWILIRLNAACLMRRASHRYAYSSASESPGSKEQTTS